MFLKIVLSLPRLNFLIAMPSVIDLYFRYLLVRGIFQIFAKCFMYSLFTMGMLICLLRLIFFRISLTYRMRGLYWFSLIAQIFRLILFLWFLLCICSQLGFVCARFAGFAQITFPQYHFYFLRLILVSFLTPLFIVIKFGLFILHFI